MLYLVIRDGGAVKAFFDEKSATHNAAADGGQVVPVLIPDQAPATEAPAAPAAPELAGATVCPTCNRPL